jgi:hypothetical protein
LGGGDHFGVIGDSGGYDEDTEGGGRGRQPGRRVHLSPPRVRADQEKD